MAALIYLDTHIAVWLYAGRLDNLSNLARKAIAEQDLLVSPMVVLELQYLFEIGRTTVAAETLVNTLTAEIGLRVCDLGFAQVANAALAENWTRDPFDRLIVAQARLRDAELVTKDRHILDHYPKAVWAA